MGHLNYPSAGYQQIMLPPIMNCKSLPSYPVHRAGARVSADAVIYSPGTDQVILVVKSFTNKIDMADFVLI